MLITVPIIGHVATIKKTSQIFLKEKDKCFVCFFLKRMVKKKQKGGYYKGKKDKEVEFTKEIKDKEEAILQKLQEKKN